MDWQREIDELHAFFEAYFRGEVPVDETARLELALAPEFTLVRPDGSEADRATTIGDVRDGHGHAPDMSIRAERHRLHRAGADLVVASYVEVHAWPAGRANRRLATVVFGVDEVGAHGLRWLRVHETWMR